MVRRALATKAAPLVVALLLSACEFSFTPDIEPLVIPTAPPQLFGTEISTGPLNHPDEADSTQTGTQAQAFEPNDPLAWIELIESRWQSIDVITCSISEFTAGCAPWTAEEARLLYETLEEYVLSDYLDSQMFLIRTTSDEYAGLTASTSVDGVRSSEVRISGHAWRTPPALGLFDLFDPLFRRENHFQGTVAHELTHAAAWFHPELLDWWMTAQEEARLNLGPGDWRVGYRYDWSFYEALEDNPEQYRERVQGELFALAVAALMYDPWWGKGN